MKKWTFLILFVFFSSAWAQTSFGKATKENVRAYYSGLTKAKLLIAENENEKAIDEMIKVLQLNIGYSGDAYFLLKTLLENTPKESASYMAKLSNYCSFASQNGLTLKDINGLVKSANKYGNYYRADSLKPLYYITSHSLKSSDFIDKKTIKRNEIAYKKARKPFFNKNLSKEIKQLEKIDQTNRVKNRSGSNDDSIVFAKLKPIIEKNKGLPKFYEVTEDNYEDLDLFLCHMDLDKIIEILPYLIEGTQNGDFFISEGILYAIDRAAVERGEYLKLENGKFSIVRDSTRLFGGAFPSGYGGFFFSTKENRKDMHIFPISDLVSLEEVNKLRALLLLPSLEEHAKINHFKIMSLSDFKQHYLNQNVLINTYL